MPKGSIMWGCKKCDYDICQKCYDEENIEAIMKMNNYSKS